MTKLTRRQVQLDKIETTVGVEAVPDAATDGVVAMSGNAVTPEGQEIGNDRLTDTLSRAPHSIGQLVTGYKRTCEVRGGGIVGSAVNPPEFDALLQASGMVRSEAVFLLLTGASGALTVGEELTGGTSGATGTVIAEVGGGVLLSDVAGVFVDAEDVTGGTSAETATVSGDPVTGWQYLPTSEIDTVKSVTTHFYQHGHKHVLTGCRATFAMTLPVGQVGTIEFTQRGRFHAPVEAPMPTPVLNVSPAPVVVGAGMTVGDRAPQGVNEVSVDIANALTDRNDINAPDGLDSIAITGREPTCGLDPLAESLDDWNPWTQWKDGDLAAIGLTVGKEAGNRVFVSMPSVQYASVAYGDRDGMVSYDLSGSLKGVAGDDELRLVFF